MATKHPADENQHSKAETHKASPRDVNERSVARVGLTNTNRGNFANNRERARDAGRKGGKS